MKRDNIFVFEGKDYRLDDACEYMDNEIREKLHSELAPCSAQLFWDRYYEEDEKGANEIISIIGEYR